MDGKLTKKFLMALPQDVYLVSNIFSVETGRPAYEGQVVPMWARHHQWKKIKEAGANGRLCRVFRTKELADKWPEHIFADIR